MDRVLSSFNFGNLTATANTEITALCPPKKYLVTRVTSILYRCGTTAHTITILKSLGRTKLEHNAAASQAVIILQADPGTGTVAGGIAANDFVCVELSDGTFFLGKVSSVSSLNVTLTASLPAAALRDAHVWFFGAPGNHASSQTTTRSVPVVGGQLPCTASVLNSWQDFASGLCQASAQHEPLMVHSNNATAAGTFEMVVGQHSLNTGGTA